jgi:uncharacterized membrane protein
MFQKVAVAFLVLGLTYMIMAPLVRVVAQSMDNSANMIAEASHGAS